MNWHAGRTSLAQKQTTTQWDIPWWNLSLIIVCCCLNLFFRCSAWTSQAFVLLFDTILFLYFSLSLSLSCMNIACRNSLKFTHDCCITCRWVWSKRLFYSILKFMSFIKSFWGSTSTLPFPFSHINSIKKRMIISAQNKKIAKQLKPFSEEPILRQSMSFTCYGWFGFIFCFLLVLLRA